MGRLQLMNMKGCSPDVLAKEKLRRTFKKHDKNGDGKLSFEELQAAFRELGGGITWYQTELAFRHVDKNESGYIDLEEELEALIDYSCKKGGFIEADANNRHSFTKADANGDSFIQANATYKRFINEEEINERGGFIEADANNRHSFTKADANNANGDSFIQANATYKRFINEEVINERGGFIEADANNRHSFTKADANNANGDSFIQANATYKRFINEEEINERAKYATRYGLTASFELLTKEQLMEKCKQCVVNNARQLSKAELKKHFQDFNNKELNILVEHAPELGFTVEP